MTAKGVGQLQKSCIGLLPGRIGLLLVVFLFATVFKSDAKFQQTQTTYISTSHSALLLSLQTKHAAFRPQKSDINDGHPKDLHPSVEGADPTSTYVKAEFVTFAQTSNLEPIRVGFQARAPPFVIMPIQF